MANLNVTELDFEQIKANLKNYLKTQSEFNDYDLEGSGINVLLDVLSYNTHYNAMTAHYALNEAFLDSAQLRGNVVSRANMLGYTPRSRLASRATVDITIDASEIASPVAILELPRGTKLISTVDGEEYNFVVLESQSVAYAVATQSYSFTNVLIAQGTYRTALFRVDNDIENQKFQLGDVEVDTTSLRVRVQLNQESEAYDIYTQFETLNTVDSASQVYFLQENASNFYEVYFGDGVIGKRPSDNNIVTLDYVITDAEEANGASIFTLSDDINGYDVATVTTLSASAGGTAQETTESVRYNAPLTFITQNRAVTADDYRAIISKSFSNIESISTWGGEDNDQPDFGSVYVSIKPLDGDVLSEDEKILISDTILKGKNVVSITPNIVDADFTNIELDVIFKYNSNLTDRSSVEMESLIKDVIQEYNFNNLNKFDGVFRHSELSSIITNSDASITSNTIRPFMFKNVTPNVGTNNFELKFAGAIYNQGGTNQHVTSTPFLINGVEHYFGDKPITGSNSTRQVIVYKVESNINVTVINDAGLIDLDNGTITLNNFIPDNNGVIRVTVTPDSLDIAPKREALLSIDSSRIFVSGEIDKIALVGSSGTIDYTTNSRMR